ncbi:hypothetical protein JCM10207_001332 [Rhodosporidiobolus poonsookiae]
MKYGKQYLESLENVPEEWRKQAIEYRKLKKVINRVASELKDLGLTSEVLKDLLETQQAVDSPPSSSTALPSRAPRAAAPVQSTSSVRWASDEDEKEGGETRIEEVIDEAEGVIEAPEEEAEMSDKQRGKLKDEGGGKKGAKVRKRRVRATYELGGTTAHPEPRIHLVFSSCSSESYSSSGPSDPSHDSSSNLSDDDDDDDDAPSASPANLLFSSPRRKSKARLHRAPHHHDHAHDAHRRPSEAAAERAALQATASGKGRLSELLGPSSSGSISPFGSTPSSKPPSSAIDGAGSGSTGTGADDDSEAAPSESGEPAVPRADELDIEFEGAGPHAKGLLQRMYGVGVGGQGSGEESEGREAVEVRMKEGEAAELPLSVDGEAASGAEELGGRPELRRFHSQETIRAATPGSPGLQFDLAPVPTEAQLEVQPVSLEALEKMKVGQSKGEKRRSRELKQKRSRELASERAEEGDDEREKEQKPPSVNKTRRRKRRPHQHRREVFIPLNSDTEFLTLLASALNSLATLQLAQKRQFTESVRILASEVSAVSSPSRPKTDLYIWREIFALWVEAAIFESARERDRGERSTEEVEKKLEWFVDQVAARKLAKRMRNKESRVALEKFIALNVELLDLKKFQIANEEAARKILKKHDKRTALTASYGFPKFLTSSSSTSSSASDASDPLALISSELLPSADGAGPRSVLTLPGFPSLPHILLSTFTNTLLPIIPALEDYECSICGDVAFKPIRLSCGHKFCVRCLVKMQKRGQDSCPQCRSPVVLRANASNLDHDLQDYLIQWFPREVKLKEKSNQKEAAREELEEMGIVDRKCVVM